jgi:8-oxo-dGTP diphosphatase
LTNICFGNIYIDTNSGAAPLPTAAADLAAYDRPSVAVDVVLLTVVEDRLAVLLIRRPGDEGWALPGGFVRIDEPLEAAVRRVLADKAHLPGLFLEQLYTFGVPGRDPRGRVISVAYYGLAPLERLQEALAESADLALATVEVAWAGETGGPAGVRLPDGATPPLAFDHADILGAAVKRLRGKLDYAPVGLELLPARFPLRDLQAVHEAILGVRLAKPAFRRKVLDRGWLQPTGLREAASAFRPAELYERTRKGEEDHG